MIVLHKLHGLNQKERYNNLPSGINYIYIYSKDQLNNEFSDEEKQECLSLINSYSWFIIALHEENFYLVTCAKSFKGILLALEDIIDPDTISDTMVWEVKINTQNKPNKIKEEKEEEDYNYNFFTMDDDLDNNSISNNNDSSDNNNLITKVCTPLF